MLLTAKWYTRASRVRIYIAKFDGRYKIPGGPYTIPEMVAAVGGILTTLFSLGGTLHNVLFTAVVGLSITAGLVVTMRKMPYSPVRMWTRITWLTRVYVSPVSSTYGDLLNVSPVSVVRPDVTFYSEPEAVVETERQDTRSLFDAPEPAAAGLFG